MGCLSVGLVPLFASLADDKHCHSHGPRILKGIRRLARGSAEMPDSTERIAAYQRGLVEGVCFGVPCEREGRSCEKQ